MSRTLNYIYIHTHTLFRILLKNTRIRFLSRGSNFNTDDTMIKSSQPIFSLNILQMLIILYIIEIKKNAYYLIVIK